MGRRDSGLCQLDAGATLRDAPGSEEDGLPLPALRPGCEPLLEGHGGWSLRAGAFPKRDHLATNGRSQQGAAVRTDSRHDPLLCQVAQLHLELPEAPVYARPRRAVLRAGRPRLAHGLLRERSDWLRPTRRGKREAVAWYRSHPKGSALGDSTRFAG